MNTAFYIARRYLFSKKSTHAINIISGISMLGVFIGSAALIIILSVFNGFETVILSLYNNFTPELRIEPKKGKSFNPNSAYFKSLRTSPEVYSFTEVLEEKALMRYGNSQFIGTVKGVSESFLKNKALDSTLQAGSFTLNAKGRKYAVIGSAVQFNLSVNVKDELTPLQIYSPRREIINSANPINEFMVAYIYPSGVFSIQQDFDDIIVTPIEFTRDLLNEHKNVTSIEINLKNGANVKWFKEEIEKVIGNRFLIKNRYQQNTLLYKILNSEKWAVFLILTFVLIIAIFNIIGSLTMLVMDKQKDIAILTGLGAGRRLIQSIFFFEGMLISLTGCVGGVLLGLAFCLVQLKFGLIKMGGKLSMIDAYPVDFKLADFILVFITVMLISLIASGISAKVSVKRLDEIKGEL
ncbi:MAG: ABC transporter permease [Sphingobacteriaceae bacterium]